MSPEPAQADQPLWKQTLNAQRESNSGIGGVLLVMAVGLLISPFRLIYSAVNDLWPAWREFWVGWEDFESAGKMLSYLWFESASLLLALVFCLAAIYLFFGKKRFFRKFIFFWLACQLAVPFTRLVVVSFFLDSEQREIAGINEAGTYVFAVSHCLLWTLYFALSERVKNTFIR